MKRLLSIMLVITCTQCVMSGALAGIIYVDASATGPARDGTTWCTAFIYLQDALAIAQSGDEIRVAEGTYKPDQGANQSPGDRNATFQLLNGVTLRGAYAGCGAPNPDKRDVTIFETVLSGDLLGDDTPVTCSQDSPDCDAFGGLCGDNGFCIIMASNHENTIHVVTGSRSESSATLDGFTITAGNADPAVSNGNVAGMVTYDSSDMVSNCTFTGNVATNGGAMHNVDVFNSPTITNCVFNHNSASANGGGMCNENTSPTVISCIFNNNSASSGGGMYNSDRSSPAITACKFIENVASSGGGMYNEWYSSPQVENGTFRGNTATDGGGMYNASGSSPKVKRCIFEQNTALDKFFEFSIGSGGAMTNIDSSNPTVAYSTFRENTAYSGGGIFNFFSSPIVSNCSLISNIAAEGGGGGMFIGLGEPLVTNCEFIGNFGFDGGGMVITNSSPSVTNCTFRENWASNTGGGIANYVDNPKIRNCILWRNSDFDGMGESAQIYSDSGNPTVSYSIVQGGWAGAGGVGVVTLDPLVDLDGPDDILGTQDDGKGLLQGSPAIDSGINAALPADLADLDGDGDFGERVPVDLDGLPRFIDDPASQDCPQPGASCGNRPVVDMGAFEYQTDCNDNDILDVFEVPQNCYPLDCPVTSDAVAMEGEWSNPSRWCLPEVPDNNSDAAFGVIISGLGAQVTLDMSPTIARLRVEGGATVKVDDGSGADARSIVVVGLEENEVLEAIKNTGVFWATDRERLVLDAPIIDQGAECDAAGGVIKATDGEAAPGEENKKSIVEINGAVIRGGSLVTEGTHSEIHLIGGAELVDTCIRGVVVPDGQNGRFAGVVTNEDVLEVRGASTNANTRLEPAGAVATLDGAGRVKLTHKSFARLGDFKQSFTNGPLHTIEGAGIVFGGLVNEGTVEANEPGEPLILLPPGQKANSGQMRAVAGGVLRISDDVTGAGELRAEGGTIQVRSTEEDGIVVRAASMNVSSSDIGAGAGKVEMSFDSELVLTGAASIGPAGSYGGLPDQNVPNLSSLSAGSLKVLPGSEFDCGPPGELLLTDSMTITTAGNLELDGSDVPCGSVCSPATLNTATPIASDPNHALRGGRTPPTIRTIRSSNINVADNAVLSGTVAFVNTSDSNMLLRGNWDNQSTCPAGFDWLQGGLSLSGTAPQTFEVAGADLGPTGQGFGDGTHTNFAMGTLEIQSAAIVTLVDGFDNSPAVIGDCAGADALYVRNLVLQSGSQLTLNNCRLYFLSNRDDGATITTQGCGALVPLPGDIDADGDSDLQDFAPFQRCYSGNSSLLNPAACGRPDFNGDNRVNLSDYSLFWSVLEQIGPMGH